MEELKMVLQIGARLVRPLSYGGQIITEALNGKTYTKILNEAGEVIRQRVTQNSSAMVGDKLVRTRVKINQSNDLPVYKTITDRVYRDGNYLGKRRNRYTIDKTGVVFKEDSMKKLADGRYVYNDFSKIGKREYIDKNGLGSWIDCNNKGLPVPQSLSYEQCADKSIKEMQAMHFEKAPHLPYQAPEARMAHLDARTAETPTLSNLDTFI